MSKWLINRLKDCWRKKNQIQWIEWFHWNDSLFDLCKEMIYIFVCWKDEGLRSEMEMDWFGIENMLVFYERVGDM